MRARKDHAPTPPLKHAWIVPGDPYYLGQWIWDTMFVVDLLSLLPGRERQIRDVFQNYWDFQDRWNETAPEHARDMITAAIKTEPQQLRRFSQIPILAWGIERVYQRNRDRKLLEQCLGRLERFHDWYWRERDLHDNGLITLGSYSGELQHARWETFDYECNMDDMRMTAHPTRKGPGEGAWYADICVPGNTAYLIMGEQSLARLAEIMDDTAIAARRRKRIEKSVSAMRRHMWDDIADKTIANAIRNGISEHYHSVSGKALGVPDYCMSCTLVTMMLDSLTRKHLLRLRPRHDPEPTPGNSPSTP